MFSFLSQMQFLKVFQDILYYFYLMEEHRYPLICHRKPHQFWLLSDNSSRMRESAMGTWTEIVKWLPNGYDNAVYSWHRPLAPFLLDRTKWFHYINTFKSCLAMEVKDHLCPTAELYFNVSREHRWVKMTQDGEVAQYKCVSASRGAHLFACTLWLFC